MQSCILFESADGSVAVIDIPRSIEEAQVLPGQQHPGRRILSSSPTDTPWEMPEPKKGLRQHVSMSPSVAIAELMTLESVKAALETVKSSHTGPWCLPRIPRREPREAGPPSDNGHDEEQGTGETRKRKRKSPGPEATSSTAKPFIPAQSHRLLGTVESRREELLKTAPAFDLIILDPPWPSRSVRRKRGSYSTVYGMDEAARLLSQIPITSHLKPDGLVAVWVTNKAAVTDLLTSPGGMFSQWGLEPLGDWVWLKITNTGEPVVDVESQWRKPWERLLVARRKGNAVRLPVATKVIMGVPDLHSRKPNLRLLFSDILPDNYLGLEIFARNLTAGWWSWGDEVLQFQQRHHWVQIDEQT